MKSKFQNFEQANAILGFEMFPEQVERALEQAQADLRFAGNDEKLAAQLIKEWLRANGFKKSATPKTIALIISVVKA